MPDHEIKTSSTTEGLPVAPSFGPGLAAEHIPKHAAGVTRRVVGISGLAILLAIAAAFVAQALTALIGLITNLAFYGRLSTSFASPAGNHLGMVVMVVPVVGAL